MEKKKNGGFSAGEIENIKSTLSLSFTALALDGILYSPSSESQISKQT